MTGDTVTISKESHLIAIRYGKNVSRGILEMEAVIQRLEREKEIENADRERRLRVLLGRS